MTIPYHKETRLSAGAASSHSVGLWQQHHLKVNVTSSCTVFVQSIAFRQQRWLLVAVKT